MEGPHILVVTAGLGEPSATALLGDNLAEATRQALETAGLDAQFTTISLRSIAKEITNHYLTGFPMGKLAEALDAVRSADAIIAVTPVFKASYSGLFKSFWDLVEDGSLADKPVLIAATGGTARHSLVLDMAMRPLFSYLKATVAPSGVLPQLMILVQTGKCLSVTPRQPESLPSWCSGQPAIRVPFVWMPPLSRMPRIVELAPRRKTLALSLGFWIRSEAATRRRPSIRRPA